MTQFSQDPEITQLIELWQQGKQEALGDLLPKIYQPLKIVARKAMQVERSDHTLQPTALVHEAFMKMSETQDLQIENSKHFFALASLMMRRILVDHARKLQAKRRGNKAVKLTLSGQGIEAPTNDLLALDQALSQLSRFDSRKAKIIELRFFGGLSVKEISALLGISEPTVILDTRLGKAFLYKTMQEGIGVS